MERSINFPVNQVRNIKSVNSIEELKFIILSNLDKHIKILGSDHSWSGCTISDDDFYIRLDFLKEIYFIDYDIVHVGAGVIISELLTYLKLYGKTLINMGTIREQRVVGALLTGTHGSGYISSFTSMIKGITILRYNGLELEEIYLDQYNSLFYTVICSLGAGAIILYIDIMITDSFNLEEEKITLSYDIFKNRNIIEDFNYYDIYYINPYSTNFIRVCRRPTIKQISKNFFNKSSRADRFYTFFLAIIYHLNKYQISIMPFIDKFWSCGTNIDSSENIFSNLAKRIPASDIEFYIDIEQLIPVLDFIFFLFQSCKAKKYIHDGYNYHIKNLCLEPLMVFLLSNGFVTSLYLCIRTVEASYATLSGHYGKKCYCIDFEYQTIYQNNIYIKSFYKVLHDVLTNYFGCRPHWAKINFLYPELCYKLYDSRIDKFLEDIYYLDPCRVFTGKFIEKTFILEKNIHFDIDFHYLSQIQLDIIFESSEKINMSGYYKLSYLNGSSIDIINILKKWKLTSFEYYGRIFNKNEIYPFIGYKNINKPINGTFTNFLILKYGYYQYTYLGYIFLDEYRMIDDYNIICKSYICNDNFYLLLSKY